MPARIFTAPEELLFAEHPRSHSRHPRATKGHLDDGVGSGCRRSLAVQSARDLLSSAVKACREGRLSDAQRVGGLAIGKSEEVDGNDGVSE